jgi:ribosomal protein S18 acetylase RimI-like enzyme
VEDLLSRVFIRNYQHPQDYSAVYQVWRDTGHGIHISPSDTQSEIEKLVQKSPGLFFVAEYDSRIIGTVIGGFDGRRGLIYHLAVLPEFQKRHIGSRLLENVENKLRNEGCTKVYLFILPENPDLFDYYEKQGYQKMDAIPFTKFLI